MLRIDVAAVLALPHKRHGPGQGKVKVTGSREYLRAQLGVNRASHFLASGAYRAGHPSLASYQHRERAGHDLPVCHVVVYARCRFSCHISAPWYYAKNRTSIVLTDTRHATKKQ